MGLSSVERIRPVTLTRLCPLSVWTHNRHIARLLIKYLLEILVNLWVRGVFLKSVLLLVGFRIFILYHAKSAKNSSKTVS